MVSAASLHAVFQRILSERFGKGVLGLALLTTLVACSGEPEQAPAVPEPETVTVEEPATRLVGA
ncbi:MAG: hypothetical protein WBJ75_07860, partial [Pseudohongiellaceae bacterium]